MLVLWVLVSLGLGACGTVHPALAEDPSQAEDEEAQPGDNVLAEARDKREAEASGQCGSEDDCGEGEKREKVEFSSASCGKPTKPMCLWSKSVCSFDSKGCEVCSCARRERTTPRAPVGGDSQSGNILEPPN